jgi:transcriptional regulator with PAS, ATPase and Fis domain
VRGQVLRIGNDRRLYPRERLHLPLNIGRGDKQKRNFSAWTLDASPAGLLLELPEEQNFSREERINLNIHLGEHINFDLGDAIICRIASREGKQVLGVKLKTENQLLCNPSLLSANPQVLDIKSHLSQISLSGVNILIHGETGTGKNVLAKTIHNLHRGRQEPFIRVNCPSIPESLFESELFGHEKGAYTDAKAAAPGYFRLAAGGTILLDEISEIQPHLQAKLLRVIEDKNFMSVGGQKLIPVRANIISTTNLDLEKAVEQGRFRRDLYYRLCEMPLHLPPLRKRKEDIVLLAHHFLLYYCMQFHRPFRTFCADEIDLLENYSWPGNIRELENFMKQSALLDKFTGPPNASRQYPIEGMHSLQGMGLNDDFLHGNFNLSEATKKLTDQIEYLIISKMLQECCNNRTQAASRLGISYRTLLRKLEQHHLPSIENPS